MNKIYLYGEVGKDFFAWEIARLEGDVEVHLNSAGGNVFEGLTIYNLLKRCRAGIVIEGVCASAASIIACAGRVKMEQNALYMVHLPEAGLEGYFNADDLADVQAGLAAVKAALVKVYQEKTGLSEDELSALMGKESWLSAAQAQGLGFVDEVIGGAEMENAVMEKLKASVMTAERGRIKALNGLRTGQAAVDAVIEAALERGASFDEAKVYVDAVKKTYGAEIVAAQIRDNVKSGASAIVAGESDKRQAQASLIAKYANEMRRGNGI